MLHSNGMYFTPLNCTLKNSYNGKLYVVCFTTVRTHKSYIKRGGAYKSSQKEK